MKKGQIILAVIAITTFYIFLKFSSLAADYLWFDHYGQINTFFTLFFTKFTVQGIFSLLFLILIFLNTIIGAGLSGGVKRAKFSFLRLLPPPLQKERTITIGVVIAFLFLSFIMGSAAQPFWSDILKFFNMSSFSNIPNDPIFNREISFYIFALPFYNFIHGWLMGALVLISFSSVAFHLINGGFSMRTGKPEMEPGTRAHLSIIAALFLIIIGVGYYLSAFDILFSQRGKFYGAGYTAVHSQLLAYRICMVLSFIAAIILIVNIFKRSLKLAVIVIGCSALLFFLLGTIVPSLQQRFIVEPNELEKERPYITNNIKFTRLAYGLQDITTESFLNDGVIDETDLKDNQDVLNNIRLWDWRPLKQTFSQLQELKPYYAFLDVDVDRYTIDGSIRAVNLSARELLNKKLSANSQTWINNHLIYTHGYGAVMNRVDKVTPGGLPELIVKDIPPQSKFISLKKPQIYYGEHDNDFIITNSEIKPGEFDYPSGEKNSYTTYSGDGGIKLDSLFKRLVYAIAFSDVNILISSNITNNSRIHYRRNIHTIVKELAPYIIQDKDPYLVIADDQLFYIIDGYTVTAGFPYATPLENQRVNYIRNSVKVVVNAYSGETSLYVSDKTDPLIATYASIFPDLFTDFNKIPEKLRSHIRYPETIFDIQAQILLRYHMTDANVFYNNEDGWEIPNQIYDSAEQQMESYYIVTKLPGETETEFVIMVPFTPFKKDNMLSFLVARCDGDNYGKMTLYKLPKDKLSYGPLQLEARINQDAEISKQLTLWSQKGSRVIRGNMLAIPIKNSILFVEPLYLKAETSEMPELKRVIVCFRDQIIMEENLDLALKKIFSFPRSSSSEIIEPDKTVTTTESSPVLSESTKITIQRANEIFSDAESKLKNGDFEGYGKRIKELGELLKDLGKKSK